MTYSSQRLDELCKLFAALQDGELDEATVQSVERLILEDRAARRLYVSYMGICAGLQWNFGTRGDQATANSAPDAADDIAAALAVGESEPRHSPPYVESTPPQPSAAVPASPPVKSPVLGFLGGAIDYVNHSRRLMFLLVAVMLSGWFVFQVGSVLLGRWWDGNADVADRGAEQPGAPKPAAGGAAGGTVSTHGNALAWLSGSLGSRWQVDVPNPTPPDLWENGTELVAGQRVNLVAGLGEITFRSGAKVVISAPAQFSVTSALATDLQLGKLTARVPHDSSQNGTSPPGATGFTVNTPEGSVVDVGTEFGVEVTPEHKVDVQVFVGEVKVNSPSEGAGSGEAGEPGVHVTAGKTVHLEHGKPATLVESTDKNHFQRDLTIATDSGDKQVAAYLDFMRQLKPVVWLRMEGKEGDKTIHDEVGNINAKLFWDGPGNPFVGGAIGKSLWLRGPTLKDCAIVPAYPKAEHGKLSASAWVYADSRAPWAVIARNWGATKSGQFQLGLRGNTSGHSVDLNIGISQANGQGLDVNEGAEHPFPLHEWQHVAFVADGATLRLYREGREVASGKCGGLKFPTPVPSLGVGVRTDDSGAAPFAPSPMYWDGKLDEVALFNDILTPEDIKKLAAVPPR